MNFSSYALGSIGRLFLLHIIVFIIIILKVVKAQMITFVLVDVQLLLGVLVFLLPWAPLSLRALVMPMHVYSGLLIFGTVIATVLMGVTEKLIFGV